MVINLPAVTTQAESGVTQAPDSTELSPGQVDVLRRKTYGMLLDAVHSPFQAHHDRPDLAYLNGKTKYEVMCLRVLERATAEKVDMRAVEFIQEHMMGKAVQRVESQNVTVTYQDLLAKTALAEKRFAEAARRQEEPVTTTDIVDAETIPVSWDDLR